MDIAFLAHRFADRHAVCLNPAQTKHPFIRAVGKAQALVLIGVRNHHRDIIGIDPDVAFTVPKGFLGAHTRSDIGNGRDKATIGHRVGANLKHHAISALALIGVGQTAHLWRGIAAQQYINIHRPVAVITADMDKLGQRQCHLNVAGRNAKQINETVVPCRKTKVLVKHPHPLRDVFKCIEQKITVELDGLGRLIKQFHCIATRNGLVGQKQRHHHAR